jgi:type IV pilus assembly protein PilA
MRRTKGFSLIELLIVVAIILIIMAIAVPNFLRSRLQANESAAVGALRTLNTAQISYNSSYPTVGFATTLTNLGDGGTATNCGGTTAPTSTSACLIDSALETGTKSGYSFALSGATGTPTATYQLISSPIQPGTTGNRYFCSFADAVVRVSLAAITTCDNTVTPQQ